MNKNSLCLYSKNNNEYIKLNQKKLKPFLEIKNLTKSFFNRKNTINNINLTVYKGEIFALLGPSGCGKSTLLRILAGLESITTGKIFLDEKDISYLPTYKRPINIMFQTYALFPHMTVEKNISFGLKQDKLKKNEINNRVKEILNLVKMNEYAKYKPNELSGGQCQRVALARSLVKRPKLLLLDEPMGSLDKKLRNLIQLEIMAIIKKIGVTCVMVTHDQKEAMFMSNRIAIMNNGVFEQIGNPEDIYENPSNIYCAKFIGLINIFKGVIIKKIKDTIFIEIFDFAKIIEVDYKNKKVNNILINIALRPEKIFICKVLPENININNFISGKIVEKLYLGDFSIYHVSLKNGKIIISQTQNIFNTNKMTNLKLNDTVYLYWENDSYIILNT